MARKTRDMIKQAVLEMTPKIMKAVMMQPTVRQRARILRGILNGVDRDLSDRVAKTLIVLEEKGVDPQTATKQAIADELALHMHDLVMGLDSAMDGLGGWEEQSLGDLGTLTAARAESISNIIGAVGTAVNRLTATAGDIAISARQTRMGQTVTGLPTASTINAPVPAALGPAPADTGYIGGGGGAGGPPWGLIIGGLGVAGVIAAVVLSKKDKQPAPAPAPKV